MAGATEEELATDEEELDAPSNEEATILRMMLEMEVDKNWGSFLTSSQEKAYKRCKIDLMLRENDSTLMAERRVSAIKGFRAPNVLHLKSSPDL